AVMIAEASNVSPRLLLCDDSEFERRALARILRDHDYNVDEASDGAVAIDHLKKATVDLIVLDLLMPVSDGFDVLSYLQEHRKSMPVVLLSGMPVNKIQ